MPVAFEQFFNIFWTLIFFKEELEVGFFASGPQSRVTFGLLLLAVGTGSSLTQDLNRSTKSWRDGDREVKGHFNVLSGWRLGSVQVDTSTDFWVCPCSASVPQRCFPSSSAPEAAWLPLPAAGLCACGSPMLLRKSIDVKVTLGTVSTSRLVAGLLAIYIILGLAGEYGIGRAKARGAARRLPRGSRPRAHATPLTARRPRNRARREGGRQRGGQAGRRCRPDCQRGPVQAAGKRRAPSDRSRSSAAGNEGHALRECASSHPLRSCASTLFRVVTTFPNLRLQHTFKGLKLKLRPFSFLPSPKLNHLYPEKQGTSLLAVLHRNLDGLGDWGHDKVTAGKLNQTNSVLAGLVFNPCQGVQ